MSALKTLFDGAVHESGPEMGSGPELLPSRLAHAAAAVLGVTGAGISLTFPDERRLPIGSSSADAVAAERLQYTEADGPCWDAQRSRRVVVAGPHEMAQRWPGYAVALAQQTPFRAVMSLPLHGPFTGIATMDLYLTGSTELRRVPIGRTVAVADLITGELLRSLAGDVPAQPPGSTTTPWDLPWLATPAVQARLHVWQAMGILDGDLAVTDRQALDLLRAHADAHALSLAAVSALLVGGGLRAGDVAAGHRVD